MIDKDIELVSNLKNVELKGKVNEQYIYAKIPEEYLNAIENVLKELENYKSQKIYHCYQYEVYELSKELETYKKIAEKLAYELDKTVFCTGEKCTNKCKQCIIEWARKEVDK